MALFQTRRVSLASSIQIGLKMGHSAGLKMTSFIQQLNCFSVYLWLSHYGPRYTFDPDFFHDHKFQPRIQPDPIIAS